MNINLPTINNGDTVKCLDCKSPIKLESGKTLIFDFEGEYVHCPRCNSNRDIQYYHIYGEKV